MGEWRRHAIYFAPEPGPLARFGAGWLGWDPEAEKEPAAPEGLPSVLAGRRAEIVAEPRRYGFHATLKAPFRLAEGADEGELDAAAARLAGEVAGFALALKVAAVGRFVALVPDGDSAGVDALAALSVTRLDRFRAAPTAAELARRRAAGLDPRAEAHLLAWGYPWVLDRFRFHMTLTGPLDADAREPVRAALAARLAPLLAAPMPVASICRFAEGADGRFRLVRRFPLGAREGGG